MWYVIQTLGNEATETVCEKFRQAMPEGLVKETFIPRYICLKHYQKEWHEKLVPLFPDYFFIDTEAVEAEEVRERLQVLSRIMKPVCVGKEFVPVYEKEQEFLESMMDEQRIVRKSTGNLINGTFDIYEGPLMDKEKHKLIRKVDRHRRLANMEVQLFGETRQVQVTLEIVKKVSTNEVGA